MDPRRVSDWLGHHKLFAVLHATCIFGRSHCFANIFNNFNMLKMVLLKWNFKMLLFCINHYCNKIIRSIQLHSLLLSYHYHLKNYWYTDVQKHIYTLVKIQLMLHVSDFEETRARETHMQTVKKSSSWDRCYMICKKDRTLLEFGLFQNRISLHLKTQILRKIVNP